MRGWTTLGRILVIPAVLVVLEVVVRVGLVNPLFIAAPSSFLKALVIELIRGPLLASIGATLQSVSLSFIVCTLLGLPAGYVLWRYPVWERAYQPMLAGIVAAPTVLLYPVFLIFFGRTTTCIVALTSLTAIVPIILNTRQALADVNPTLVRVGISMSLSDRQILRHVLFPAAVPVIFAGIRLGLIYMLLIVVALEYLVGVGGLGFFISDVSYKFRIPDLYAAIVAVLILSAALMYGLNRVQRIVR